MLLLALDVGTIYTGWCLIEMETYRPLEFGKDENTKVMEIVKQGNYDEMVYEEFVSYGMAIGQTTLESVKWNGRFLQVADMLGKPYDNIRRAEEKVNICGSMKANDSNIRQGLIDRFGEVGTKKNKGWFYGFKKDIWSSYAVGITYIDKKRKGNDK